MDEQQELKHNNSTSIFLILPAILHEYKLVLLSTQLINGTQYEVHF